MKTVTRDFLFTGAFNGPWYPGFLSDNNAVAGKESGDINALVRMLEVHLGIPDRFPYMLERIVEAQTGISAHVSKKPKAYFAESFKQDDLAVARHFIAMRDELLMAGWNGDAKVLPERPRDAMTALSQCKNPANLGGLPDRLIAVIGSIQKRKALIFNNLFIIKDISREPILVQRLFDALQSTGTNIAPWPVEAVSEKSDTDLALARSKAASGEQFTPRGDGTLLLLQGDNSFDSAEALACWLRLNRPEPAVIIADEGSRPVLNAALARHHLPAIGAESTSPFRSALQILQLVFALQWKPLDPARLLEFLQLPLSPIRRHAGRKLAVAVAAAPGIGSEEWREAIEKSLEDDDDPAKLKERLDFWLPDEKAMLGPGSEMPAERIHAICKNLSAWARSRSHGMKGNNGEPSGKDETVMALLDAVSGQADRLSDLVDASGLKGLGSVKLMRLLDKFSGEGMGIRLSAAEEGSVVSLASPAALLGPVDTVIWWNFTRETIEFLPAKLFTGEELRSLSDKGITLPDVSDYALDLSRQWKRPLESAVSRLVLVAGETDLGEARAKHPLWDEISAGWKDADRNAVTVRTRDLLKNGKGALAVERKAVDPLLLPEPVPVFNLKNVRPHLKDTESATSLESLAGCPLKYVLKYQAGLYPAEAVALPESSKVRGNVGHRVIQAVFGPGEKVKSEKEATDRVRQALDRIIASEGTTLSMPGLETELDAFKNSMLKSAAEFWKLINEYGLTVTGVEAPIDASTELCGLKGFIDITLEDKKKKPLVLDMKYSDKGDKYYRKYLENDEAIQLSVYSRAMGEDVPVAYLSLKDARFITTSEKGFPGARAAGSSSIAETWRRLNITIEHILKKQLKKGRVVATAVAADLEALPDDAATEEGFALEPPCKFCDYSMLCGRAWTANGGPS